MAFENIVGRMTDLAQAGAAKARETAEIAKLKLNNSSEEDAIRKAYQELGKLYYAERAMAPEAPYAALCEKITASREKIEYNKQKIADIKAAGNIKDEDIIDVEIKETRDEPKADAPGDVPPAPPTDSPSEPSGPNPGE